MIREFKHDVYGYGKRQRWPLNLYSFLLSLIKWHKNRKCLTLFTTDTNIFTLLFKELKTEGKSFIFAVCRLTYEHVTSNLISLISLLAKSDKREAGVRIVNHMHVRLQTELDEMMSCYQLIITITISHKSKSFIWKRTFNNHF